MSIKFLTYDLLKRLNDSAIQNSLNRSLVFDKLPIAKSDIYPVSLSFPHNDTEVRCEIVLNRHGDKAWLDMSNKAYNDLPSESAPI